MRPPRLTLPLALPPACPQRVSYARTTSNKVVMLKGGKAAKQLAKGKPPKAPAAAAAEGEGAPKKAKQAEAAAGGKAAAAAAGVDVGRPNSKLFIENLPAATTAAMLEMLFQQFPGALAGGGGRGAGQMLGGEGSSAGTGFSWRSVVGCIFNVCLLSLACDGNGMSLLHERDLLATTPCRLQGGHRGAQQARHRVCGV